ncbi:hypothetical protein L9F63_011869 [Diploptera punctata]|uniref:asparaginase n=1 Tax=Diploptera punctata TaxID=6984 RepID=A0AAD8ENG1_DIPPU|nr:hypothetical protein L9F63_011869 [Diploptera punctata]
MSGEKQSPGPFIKLLQDNSRAKPIKFDHKKRKERRERYVLVLYTGGTIGMARDESNVLAPVPNALEKFLRELPYFNEKGIPTSYTEERFAIVCARMAVIASEENCYILYEIIEYSPLLDSSNMGLEDWIKISYDVKNNYEAYDGFVILHGTDTLAYTASALSFMFENIGKTVIIPVFESRSDGRDNILGSLVLAANFIIPEVTVFFQQKLYRGNRTIKMSTDAFHAFDSPNLLPLAKCPPQLRAKLNYNLIFRPHTIEKFRVHSALNPNVGLLRLFPNITVQAVKTFLQRPIEGVVLQTYGAGNIPSNRTDILDELQAATKRDVIIVNCTQCVEGAVVAAYETGMVLTQVGVIPGSDMTPEAALTKLSYVLSKTEWDIETKRKMMQQNLRGELTCEKKDDSRLEEDILKMEDETKLKEIMLPALFSNYIIESNLDGLKALNKLSVNFSIENADCRTPLHVACCEGNREVVEYLLLNGASVHAKDRFDNTPLMDAIQFDNHQVIKLLVQCGAHLALKQSTIIGEKLCSAAARGNLKRLQSFEFAGANMNLADCSGNTALHLAALHGNEKIVEYLLSKKVNVMTANMMGYTAIDIAKKMNRDNILQLLVVPGSSSGSFTWPRGVKQNNIKT